MVAGWVLVAILRPAAQQRRHPGFGYRGGEGSRSQRQGGQSERDAGAGAGLAVLRRIYNFTSNHCSLSRLAETGIDVLSSCAKIEMRNSSSIQRYWISTGSAIPSLRCFS